MQGVKTIGEVAAIGAWDNHDRGTAVPIERKE